MLTCVQAVADLSLEQRARVAMYLHQRYGIQLLREQLDARFQELNQTIDKLRALARAQD